MSLRILKAGILDSLQDRGRFGYQHLGINPTGAMDKFSAAVANALTGNDAGEAVIEMHFPAAVFLFDQPALIALSGADFDASVNGEPLPVNHPVLINKSSVLQFHSLKNNARCYLAVKGGFKLNKWLNSYSTHLQANAGGADGTKLKKGDLLELNMEIDLKKMLGENDFRILPWQANETWENKIFNEIPILPGPEWEWLTEDAKEKFLHSPFTITLQSDRMGYRLEGAPLKTCMPEELVSSAVCFGTIQLLPDGRLIVLMADHQTTGGYPRIGTVITAFHSRLAQLKAGDKINFRFSTQKKAEELLIAQQQHLLQLQNACIFRLENFIHENN
jgi:antagonist of KipI